MKVMRKMEVLVNGGTGGFKVGDQIHVGKHYTATCQKVGKSGAIFMFDQYLDKDRAMNLKRTNKGGYEASDLRKFLKELVTDSIFDEIREVMVPFKKTGDLLRIPTAEEMFGLKKVGEYCETLSNKKQWPLMKNRYNRIAFRGEGQDLEWGWLQNKFSKYSDTDFVITNFYGKIDNCVACDAIGVRVVLQLKEMRGL